MCNNNERGNAMKITRKQAIEYLDSLGDSVDWTGWTLAQIRAEVLKGDDYDGMGIWDDILEHYGAEDITEKSA